jgi:hypothetical protein
MNGGDELLHDSPPSQLCRTVAMHRQCSLHTLRSLTRHMSPAIVILLGHFCFRRFSNDDFSSAR